MCLRAADLPAGPHDVELGTVAGVPVVIDGDQDSRWRHPSFHLDVAAGAAGGFSLEALEDLRFTAGPGALPSRYGDGRARMEATPSQDGRAPSRSGSTSAATRRSS